MLEVHEQKKKQKRVQLRQLLKNKFKNKYLVLNRVKDPELTAKITAKIDGELHNLFHLEKFQERDLVQADRSIRYYVMENNTAFKSKSKSIDYSFQTMDFKKNTMQPRNIEVVNDFPQTQTV